MSSGRARTRSGQSRSTSAGSSSARSARRSPTRRSALTRSTSAGSDRARPTPSPATNENAHQPSHTRAGRLVKGTRWSLLKAPERQTVGQLATLWEVQHANPRPYPAFLLREELRLLYPLPDPTLAPAHLDAWLAWASRSRLRPFVRL